MEAAASSPRRRVRRHGPAIAAACGAAALAAAAAVGFGLVSGEDGIEGWRLAARYTARLAFFLFLPVYLASAWHQLAPSAASRFVLERRRALGLGFAVAHTVHLAALTTFLVAAESAPDLATILVGGAAYAGLFAMAATSNDASVRLLRRRWRTLHRTGLHLLWFVFAFTYVTRMERDAAFFAPLAALALGALGVRLVAAARRRQRRQSSAAGAAARTARSSASR